MLNKTHIKTRIIKITPHATSDTYDIHSSD